MEKLQQNLRSVLLVCFTLLSFSVYSQIGTVRGDLSDDINGETIPFANILVVETGGGVSTDLDGKFSIDLPVGIYTFNVSYIGYADLSVSEIEVTEKNVTLVNLRLKEESEVLQEIVVTAKASRNTEAALMTIQKKAPGLLNGVTTQAIKRAGDGDVGAAIKRVTGVSVEAGKYVVVRGLADRYSKTVLNGLEIPGLDPDKNSVQLDLFPTNLVDNIIVYKSFTPDLPGDFSGGMVNIETKEFPETKTLEISAGIGYNPDMNLKSSYITYEGGNTDFLGFDDGTRALPFDENTNIPERTEENPLLTDLTSSFSPIMGTMRQNSGLNSSFALSLGNQVNKEKFDIGYTFSANYKNTTEYYEDSRFGVYFKEQNDKSIYELTNDRSDVGDLGSNNIVWSTLAGISVKTQKHKISLSALRSQNGETKAANLLSIRKEFGQAILDRSILEYTERSVSNLLLKGSHNTEGGKFSINWQLSPTVSKMEDPDIRSTSYEINPDSGAFELNPSTGGLPVRVFRYLDEKSYAGRIDFTLKAGNKIKNKIKFGFNGVYKERDFSILKYNFALHKRGTFTLTGDPNELFFEENLWTSERDRGLFVDGARELSQSYNARMSVLAGYAMNEMEISKSFKAIYGLRVEQANIWYTGRKELVIDPATDLYDDRKILNELDFLPSVNFVQTLKDLDGKTMNLRASVSRTIARPTFKEKSIGQIRDFIANRAFQGNPDLLDTKIINTDIRWEYYLPKGETFSVSGFYKRFTDHIELTAFADYAPTTFTPRNAPSADLFGVEIELVKKLTFIAPSLDKFSVALNTTLVHSATTRTEAEIAGKVQNLRDGEVLSETRQMVGQSPYVVNASVNYIEPVDGIELNLSYNVQGERLAILGVGQVPDIYEKPFHSLNVKASKKMGEDQRIKLSISVTNLLGSDRNKDYRSFNAMDQIFESLSPNRTISFGASYRFF